MNDKLVICTCPFCKTKTEVWVPRMAFKQWKTQHTPIEEAMPDLFDTTLETLEHGTCLGCQEAMMKKNA